MTELGTLLQEARIARGLTIENMVERTKIRAHFLQAMEQGAFEKLPDPAYVRPFLRTYARALGLEEEKIVLEYDARSTPSKEELAGLREHRQQLQRKKRWHLVSRGTIIAVLIIGAVYILYKLIFT